MNHGHFHSGNNCQELSEQLSVYLDGELEAALCRKIEAHLADCPHCRIMVDTTRKTITLFRRRYRQQSARLPVETVRRLWQALEQAGCVATPKN